MDAIDLLIEELVQDGAMGAAIEEDLASLIEEISRARSVDEVRALLEGFPAVSIPANVQELMTRASFAARVAGELNAPIED